MTNRRYLSSLSALFMVASFSALLGCTHVMEYKPKYLGTTKVDKKQTLVGKCAIYTTSRDDSYIFQGPPGSVFSSAETLKIPLGLITKNAAIRVFDEVCSEVSTVDKLDGNNYDIAIYPRPIGFEYYFTERGFLRLVITPQVVVHLQIEVFNSKQDVILSKAYKSEVVSGKNIYIPMTGWEKVNVAAHETILELLGTAAKEIVSTPRE